MSYKLIAFLILSSCLVQVSVSQTVSDVRAALNDLRYLITSNLTAAFESYTRFSQLADSNALLVKSNGTSIIQSFYERYIQELEDIIKSAEEANLDISTCRNRYEDYIRSVGPNNTNDLIECVNEWINSTVDYFCTRHVSLIQTALEIAYEAEKEMVYCGQSDSSCLYGLTVKIRSKDFDRVISTVDREIRRDARGLEPLFYRVQEYCGAKYTNIAEGKGKYGIDEFKKCINQLGI